MRQTAPTTSAISRGPVRLGHLRISRRIGTRITDVSDVDATNNK